MQSVERCRPGIHTDSTAFPSWSRHRFLMVPSADTCWVSRFSTLRIVPRAPRLRACTPPARRLIAWGISASDTPSGVLPTTQVSGLPAGWQTILSASSRSEKQCSSRERRHRKTHCVGKTTHKRRSTRSTTARSGMSVITTDQAPRITQLASEHSR